MKKIKDFIKKLKKQRSVKQLYNDKHCFTNNTYIYKYNNITLSLFLKTFCDNFNNDYRIKIQHITDDDIYMRNLLNIFNEIMDKTFNDLKIDQNIFKKYFTDMRLHLSTSNMSYVFNTSNISTSLNEQDPHIYCVAIHVELLDTYIHRGNSILTFTYKDYNIECSRISHYNTYNNDILLEQYLYTLIRDHCLSNFDKIAIYTRDIVIKSIKDIDMKYNYYLYYIKNRIHKKHYMKILLNLPYEKIYKDHYIKYIIESTLMFS